MSAATAIAKAALNAPAAPVEAAASAKVVTRARPAATARTRNLASIATDDPALVLKAVIAEHIVLGIRWVRRRQRVVGSSWAGATHATAVMIEETQEVGIAAVVAAVEQARRGKTGGKTAGGRGRVRKGWVRSPMTVRRDLVVE